MLVYAIGAILLLCVHVLATMCTGTALSEVAVISSTRCCKSPIHRANVLIFPVLLFWYFSGAGGQVQVLRYMVKFGYSQGLSTKRVSLSADKETRLLTYCNV
jgi:hypothetical protein